MSSLSRRLIRHTCQSDFGRIPAEVVDKAKLCLLHALVCSFAGYSSKWSKAAAEMVREQGNGGTSSVWFYDVQVSAAEAAFANGVMAQSILHEDIHRKSNAHPGIIVIPSAIAVGEQYNATGKEIIMAIVSGYEMMGKIGRAISSEEFGKRGFRPTSIIGTFASSAAAGSIMGLSEDQHVSALGLAGNFTSGVNEWAYAGTDDLYFQNGTSARNGVIAANLAKKGIEAPETIFEGKAGICKAYGLSLEKLEIILGQDESYDTSDVLFKPAPACALVQSTAQVALDAAQAGVNPNDIEEGVIKTFALGKNYPGCDYQGPFKGIIQARMSNQYNFAAALLRNSIDDEVYQDYGDQEINDLAKKMHVKIDQEIDRQFPKLQPVEVELRLKNGETLRFKRDEPAYLGRADIVAKWFKYGNPVLGEEKVYQIIETIEHLEAVEDIRELIRLMKVPNLGELC